MKAAPGVGRGQAEPICWALTLTVLLQLLRVLGVRAVALLPAQRRREEVFSNHPFPDGAKTFTASFQIPARTVCQRASPPAPSLRPRCDGRRWPSCAERGWQEPVQSPSWCWGSRGAQSSHRTCALVPTCGRSSPSLSDWSCQSPTHSQGGKLGGRHEQSPNPSLTPPSLQSQYLKQTIAMITTTMTNSSPAVAEPTIRGSSWKVLLVEPIGRRGRN